MSLLCAVGAANGQVNLKEWKLVWEDDFDYADKKLEQKWESQNGPNGHILCSRWRENAVVEGGTLKLENRKENRGGQEWTSGSIWTKEQFQYGYFECRYRYAAANATNNSFWLMTRGGDPKEGKRFEIDINEGHFPNEVNTNIHNWTDITTNAEGRRVHPSDSRTISYGVRPDINVQLEIPIKATKLRLTSNTPSEQSYQGDRAYGISEAGYPKVLSKTADSDVKGLVNYVRQAGVKITSSGTYNDNVNSQPKGVADGHFGNGWNSQVDGEKWIEIEFPEARTLGAVQIVTGWSDAKGSWHKMLSDYRLEYFNGTKWIQISKLNATEDHNFARDYHTYGLEWNEEELIFYFDGEEIRREKNEFCHSPAPVFLSLAIIKWDGEVTDAVDGTSMEVDYVRYIIEKREINEEKINRRPTIIERSGWCIGWREVQGRLG